MKKPAVAAILGAAIIPVLLAFAGNSVAGCKKDEPPPPLPVASDTPAPPPATVQLTPDLPDAADETDGDGDAKHFYGGHPDVGGLRACCNALAGNAASMPPPQNMYAANAAAYCQAMVASINSPGQKDAMIAGIRGALRGATLPAACH